MAQPRPWHTGKAKPPKKSIAPLIPAKWINVPTQRLMVVSLFCLLQALKLGARATSGQSTLTMLQWTAADVLFVLVLPILSIPWLSFSASSVVMQASLLVGLDLIVFGRGNFVWWVLTLGPKLLFGSRTKHQSIAGRTFAGIDSHGHLLGKYVVAFLPESSAYMDVLEPLCFEGKPRETVYLHIGLKSAWPSEIELLYAPLGDGPQRQVQFSAADISTFHRTENELWVPVSDPGQYMLVGLTDAATDMAVRIKPSPKVQENSPVLVPSCPTVELLPLENPSVCVGETVRCELRVVGLAPLTVLANGEWTTIPGPALDDHNASHFVDERVVLQKVASVGGPVHFDVDEVRDGLGNVVTTHMSKQGTVYDLPVAQVVEPNKRWPLVSPGSPVRPGIQVKGADGPFRVGIRRDDEVVYYSSSDISLDKVGSYDLVDVVGQRCQNSASGSFEVFEPPQLRLNVTFAQVEDKCAGPSGINADLSVEGSPPFRVWYRTIKKKTVISEEVVDFPADAGNTGRVRFKPQSVGSYIYEFTAVRDAYRYEELAGPEYSQSQRISELAGASFSHGIRTRYCQGEPVSVDVKLQGKAPLVLEYEVVSPDGSTATKTAETDSSNAPVRLGLDITTGGNYHMRLKSITDGRGCVTDLGGKRSPDIYVRSDRPSVRFQHPGSYTLTENTWKELPLVFSGEGTAPPLTVKYKHNGQVHVLELFEPVISVDKPGLYELLDLSDSECPGYVDESANAVSISMLERPTISIVRGEDSKRCINADPAVVTLALTGEPPFTVWHETADPTGFSVVNNVTTSDTSLNMTLAGSTALTGTWKHFWWITDSHYTTVSKNAESSVAWTESFTHPKPEAAWGHPRRNYEVCTGQEEAFKGIPLNLRGQPPFHVVVEGTSSGIRGERWYAEASLSQASGANLRKIVNEAPLGVSHLRLVSVKDGNGCEEVLPAANEWNQVTLNRRAAAEVVMPPVLDYCVGDRVVVGMKGSAPFSLEYKFDGKKQRATVDSEFSRYASQPGKMEMTSIKDTNGCPRDLTDTSPIVIHQLPSSRITHQSHYNIHHGDKAELWFEFTGEPPFTATFIRSVNGKIKERKTVKNVMTHNHSVIAEKDGTYEVLSLSDKYCQVSI